MNLRHLNLVLLEFSSLQRDHRENLPKPQAWPQTRILYTAGYRLIADEGQAISSGAVLRLYFSVSGQSSISHFRAVRVSRTIELYRESQSALRGLGSLILELSPL